MKVKLQHRFRANEIKTITKESENNFFFFQTKI